MREHFWKPNLSKLIWIYLNLSELIWTFPNLSIFIWTNLNIFKLFQTYLNLSKLNWTYQSLTELIWTYPNLSELIWKYPNISQHFLRNIKADWCCWVAVASWFRVRKDCLRHFSIDYDAHGSILRASSDLLFYYCTTATQQILFNFPSSCLLPGNPTVAGTSSIFWQMDRALRLDT